MKLDPRIIEGKKPLTCFDVEEAKQFIGRKCYFSNEYWVFEDIEENKKFVHTDILTGISDSGTDCFVTGVDYYQFLFPYEWVQEKKEKQPKYRPYKDYDEMSRDFSVGQIIIFKDKGYNSVHYAEIVEAFENKCGDFFVVIGNAARSLAGWFQTIEVKDPETDQWVPFGVEE